VHAPSSVYLISLAVAGLIGGIAAIVMRRQIIIVSTAYNGAFGMMFALFATFTNRTIQTATASIQSFDRHVLILLACTILLGTVGAYVQFALGPKAIGAPAPKPKQSG